jgi:uncharacterized membrane protein YbhN (UPF0104 family)
VLLSVALVAVYAAFLEWLFGWARILDVWRGLDMAAVAGALGLLLLTYVLRALRIRDYFRAETGGRFTQLLRMSQLHTVLNVLLPFRSGEASFPLLLRTEFGVPLARGTSALLVMRALDLHALLAAGGFGLVLTADGAAWAWMLWALFLCLPAVGYAAQAPALGLAMRVSPTRAKPLLAGVAQGLPESGAQFARAWAMTLVNWFAKIAVLAAVLALMGVQPPQAAIGGALGGELSSVLPVHAPGGVGSYPAAIGLGAAAFGFDADGGQIDVLAQAGINLHLLVLTSSCLALVLFSALAGLRRRGA